MVTGLKFFYVKRILKVFAWKWKCLYCQKLCLYEWGFDEVNVIYIAKYGIVYFV